MNTTREKFPNLVKFNKLRLNKNFKQINLELTFFFCPLAAAFWNSISICCFCLFLATWRLCPDPPPLSGWATWRRGAARRGARWSVSASVSASVH